MSETIGSLIKMMRGRRTGFVYAHEYAKRIEAAYGEMLSEMARLKVENGEKDAEIARLKAALKPVIDCVIMPYLQPESLNCHNALRAVNEAKRVMREGEAK